MMAFLKIKARSLLNPFASIPDFRKSSSLCFFASPKIYSGNKNAPSYSRISFRVVESLINAEKRMFVSSTTRIEEPFCRRRGYLPAEILDIFCREPALPGKFFSQLQRLKTLLDRFSGYFAPLDLGELLHLLPYFIGYG